MTNEMEWKGSVKCHSYSLEAFRGPFYDDRKGGEREAQSLPVEKCRMNFRYIYYSIHNVITTEPPKLGFDSTKNSITLIQ
jgi:hypothetical protein